MLLRLLCILMEGDNTRLRAPYVDTLRASLYASQYWHLDRVVGVLVCGDILCCNPSSGILTGPLYEEPKRVPKGVSVLLLFYHKHTQPIRTYSGIISGIYSVVT